MAANGEPSLSGRKRARVLVFGYGELGAAAVEALSAAGADVIGLVLPSNRSGADVDLARRFAAQRGVSLFVQPPRRAIEPFVAQLKNLEPDLILVWSYSMILPAEVINVAPGGCVNLHGGLLPEYRGGHVMQWAIINGERETGMTLHYIDEGVDTGPVIAEERFPIEWEDDAASLRGKLKSAGIRLIKDWWPFVANGTAPRTRQDETRARYYRLRTAADGLIDWAASSLDVYNLVRALVDPWPGAFTFWRGRKLIIRRVKMADSSKGERRAPGLVCGVGKEGVRVRTGDGELLICEAEVDSATARSVNLSELGISEGERLGTQ